MVYLRSLDDQTQIPIEEGENLLVGRLNKCDVVIEDPSVSSQHARLHLLGGVLRVVDVGSTNGTRVNYTALRGPEVLLDGDTVEFGSVSFSVDGSELQEESEGEDGGEEMFSDMEPLDASQPLDATMSISMSEEEMGERTEVAVSTDLEEVEASGEEEDAEEEGQGEWMDPQTVGMWLALAMLALAAVLIFLYVWMGLAPGT